MNGPPSCKWDNCTLGSQHVCGCWNFDPLVLILLLHISVLSSPGFLGAQVVYKSLLICFHPGFLSSSRIAAGHIDSTIATLSYWMLWGSPGFDICNIISCFAFEDWIWFQMVAMALLEQNLMNCRGLSINSYYTSVEGDFNHLFLNRRGPWGNCHPIHGRLCTRWGDCSHSQK